MTSPRNAMIGNGKYACGCEVWTTPQGNLGITWCRVHDGPCPECAARAQLARSARKQSTPNPARRAGRKAKAKGTPS
jgi:hypothetical protein